MKTNHRIAKLAASLMLVACIAFGASQTSWAGTPKGVEDDGTCTIYSKHWGPGVPDSGISLYSAMYWANGLGGHTWCKNGVKLETNVEIESPLIVKAVQSKPDAPFVIDGNGKVLDLVNWEDGVGGTYGANGHGCAVYVESSDVIIKNLKIKGKKALAEGKGVHGICVAGSNVRIMGEGTQYVEVRNVNNGIKLESTDAQLNRVKIEAAERGVVLSGSKNMLDTVRITGNATTKTEIGVLMTGDFNLLNNVDVLTVQKGIQFGEGVQSNVVFPTSSVTGQLYGIVDNSSAYNDTTNIVMMTTRIPERDGNYTVLDDDGFIIWREDFLVNVDKVLNDLFNSTGQNWNIDFEDPGYGDGANDIDISLTAMGLLKSKKAVVPIIENIEEIGSDEKKFRVTGFFAEVDPSELSETDVDENSGEDVRPSFDPIACDEVSGYNAVSRLAIFMDEGNEVSFMGAVGKDDAFGIDDEGRFDFYVDPGENVDVANTRFVMIPMGGDWQLLGRSSNYKTLAQGQSDCQDGTVSDENQSNNPGSTSWSMEKLTEWFTAGDCSIATSMESGNVDTTTDSDIDGIPDFLEMGIVRQQVAAGVYKWVYDPDSASCQCDLQGNNRNLTCWYDPDSDHDGIKDGVDGYEFYNQNYEFYADKDYLDSDYPTDDSSPAWHGEPMDGTRAIVLEPQPLNTDEGFAGTGDDTKPDCTDRDSDGDGKKDGEEDRSRVYNEGASAYWMYLDTTLSPYYYDGEGERVACTQELKDDPNGGYSIGIMYGIYLAGGTGEFRLDEPMPVNAIDLASDPSLLDNGRGLYPMACRNESASDAHNYNGGYDGDSGETDFQDPDTDDDCVCDGGDGGCQEVDTMAPIWDGFVTCIDYHNGVSVMDNEAWQDDQCPEKKHPDKFCSPKCVAGEVMSHAFEHAPPEFVEEVAGEVRFVDSDNNHLPDLFEQTAEECDADTGKCVTLIDFQLIYDSCSDIDDDGIPDCLERWSWTCEADEMQTTGLDPYDPDYDDDGLVDGMGTSGDKEDVCPFTAEIYDGGDEFTATNPHYSCSPYDVYTSHKKFQVLSCFFDRDGDGVRDCVEDKDQNGHIDSPMDGLAGIMQSESDPLNPDTDGDTLNDYDEFYGWPYRTNAAKADTDDDDMDDKFEDHDGNGKIQFSDQTGMECAFIGQKDTDPRKADSDGDGLPDNQEMRNGIISREQFIGMLDDPTIWFEEGGVSHGSDPNSADSDNDGLLDSEEYNGSIITPDGSNPCIVDSDGDSMPDADELPLCRLNPDPNCIGSEDGLGDGYDGDSDGLSDLAEAMLGTDPDNFDTDGDGLKDGDEDTNHNGTYEPSLGETNALVADTDGDSIIDGFEHRYGTDPTNIDTDGDCIPDGIEDANGNGQFDMGSETNALSSDTDGDDLPDGWIASSGMGEDLNCNGIRDADAEGRYLETDPRNPDSDLDGYTDYEEMIFGGRGFTTANISRATTGREGCSMVGSASGSPTSMFYLMGMLLAAVKALAIKRRKASA